jgi:DNA polymerase III subunit delta
MASLGTNEFDRFVKSGCHATPLILVYGPDEGLIRTRIKAISTAILGPQADPLSLLDLEADQLSGDPGRLADEVYAINMFGGKRLLILRHAGRLHKSTWTAFFERPPSDSTIIFHADELTKSSALRLACEQSPHAMAIACYAPSTADLGQHIDQRVRKAGLTISPVARAALLDQLGADFALSDREIDKLLVYCHGQLTIEPKDIEASLCDTSVSAMSEAIDLAFEGKLEAIEPALFQSFRAGINPAALLANALSHVILLGRLSRLRDKGGLDLAMRKEGVFFKRIERIKRQLTLWNDQRLARALSLLALAQEQGRLNATLEDSITIRALWSISLATRRH